MSVHFVSLRGDRTSNEDNHNIIIGMDKNDPNVANINYYGIYDGHGGKFVSKFLAENLYHFFIDKNTKYPLDKQYVNKVYDKLQSILFTKYEKESTDCGSTCLVVCHFKDETNKDVINIINSGDSRCVLCRHDIGMSITRDHKPDWPNEKRRINKLGGNVEKDAKGVWRINDLSVSRAFGDKESKQYISHRPEIYKYTITEKDRFMIMGCDGLWDEVAPQEAVNFILENCYDIDMNRINKMVNIARRLGEYAIKKGSSDNVTIIIVFFD